MIRFAGKGYGCDSEYGTRRGESPKPLIDESKNESHVIYVWRQKVRERTKHRIKMFCFGLALIAAVWLLVPSPLCIIPRLCAGGFSIANYLEFGGTKIQTSEVYVNVPGFLALVFASTWVMGILGGIALIYSAVKPEKYELRHCPNCNVETQQFKSGSKFKEGFKHKRDTPPKLLDAVKISYQYTCESCRQKVDVPNPNYNPDIDVKEPVICNNCNEPMRLINRADDMWGCFKDDRLYNRKENKIAEHAGLREQPSGGLVFTIHVRTRCKCGREIDTFGNR